MKKLTIKTIKISGLVLLVLLFSRCLNEVQKKEVKNKYTTVYQDSIFGYKFEFPDTIMVNKEYNGKLQYNSIFDTITTRLTDTINERIIVFSLAKSNKINSLDNLRKIAIDTFDATDVHSIPFKNIKFPKLGIYYIDGIISDNIIIDTNKVKNDSNNIRYIVKEFRATHKVVVIANKR